MQKKLQHHLPRPGEVSIDGETALEDLSFRDVSDYEAVPSGSVEVEIRADDNDNGEVFSGVFGFEAGIHYTLAVLPGENEEDVQVLIFRDEVTISPEEDRALVRVLHALADAENVDVVVADDEEGLGFTESTDYFSVPADSDLEIREAGADEAITEVSADDKAESTRSSARLPTR